MRPPAPVTSTVLLDSAMATTPNLLPTLFTPSFLLSGNKPNEEEKEDEKERERKWRLNEEEETGRGSDGATTQYLRQWLGEVVAAHKTKGTRVAIPITVVGTLAWCG